MHQGSQIRKTTFLKVEVKPFIQYTFMCVCVCVCVCVLIFETSNFYLPRSCQVYGSFSVVGRSSTVVSVSSFVSSSFIVFKDYIR